jgi:hypothetical protein
MSIDWKKIAKEAGTATDEHFKNQISSLTSLNDDEIQNMITETGISKKDLVAVLKEVTNATKKNNTKAAAISKINKGVSLLVSIAKKAI